MDIKTKIFSFFFLLVYGSFLFHGFFAHDHIHPDDPGHEHCAFTEGTDKSAEKTILRYSHCEHIKDNCSICGIDESLHEHFVFTKDFHSDQKYFIPSVRYDLNIGESKLRLLPSPAEESDSELVHLTFSRRGPPEIS